ncbi:zinc carboxypeptidase [Melghirimyces profundicolus]|uniref:Zinc carboxypeptidase n=1 Tax=Melghirimyces profundicolus TaxID=1242148 RepID=A0A2T6C0I4_9BACL|nr:M14 family zinc carboxypeptidase [Melghirimyces profundicolus]PTX61826.1 zinc carboxypeptidase [Melghirimyces profundicolus]
MRPSRWKWALILLLTLTALAPMGVWSHHADGEADRSLFNSEHYDFVKYSRFDEILKDLKQNPRVTVRQQGTSAGGHPMYVVTVSEPGAEKNFARYQRIRKQMLNNHLKADAWKEQNTEFKVPIMINGSIHGTEFVGSDAVLKLLDRFANGEDDTTRTILKESVLVFNLIANPDGRISATRFNAEGFDLNRDFITQSQPETQQMVDLITRWHPLVLLDLHGYVKFGGKTKPGLMEPCTPPHNPNYEYDLFSKWALDQAEAMEGEVVKNRSLYESDLYRNMTGTYIPARDDTAGWDDYPPIFTPMYAMYHGSYAYTLEAPTNDWDGVRWHVDAVMGALKFTVQNKNEMLEDQLEMFRRGIRFNHPHHPEEFFPQAYILPVDPENPGATRRAVNHLIDNDIRVEKARTGFSAGGVDYPSGTYIVPMDQAKAGLANTMLWEGEDISEKTPAMYDISAWSLPQLWGFQADPINAELDVTTTPVKRAENTGSLQGNGPYRIPNQSVEAVTMVNRLLQEGVAVYRDRQGDFYVRDSGPKVLRAVRESGLTLNTAELPKETEPVESMNVAILKDGGTDKSQSHAGTRHALERMGFRVTELHPRTVAEKGLEGYDVFVYAGTSKLIRWDLSKANREFGLENEEQYRRLKEQLHAFVQAGGTYVAVGSAASEATVTLELSQVKVQTGGSNSNGIVQVDNADHPLTAGYEEEDLGFVYRPGWYTDTDSVTVAASYGNGNDFFQSGHWRGRNEAQGKPVIVREKNHPVVLIGLEPAFRGHTAYLYRYLSNAIWSG